MKKIIYIFILTFITFLTFSSEVKAVTGKLSLYCKYEGSTIIDKESGESARIQLKVKLYDGRKPEGKFIISTGSNTKSRNAKNLESTSLKKCPSTVNVTICIASANNAIGGNAYASLTGNANGTCAWNTYNTNLSLTVGKTAAQLSDEGFGDDYEEIEDVICPFCVESYQIWRLAGYVLLVLKILVPLIIIIAGFFDFLKAMTAGNDDEMKKAGSIAVKRLIAGIIIFFIPTIIKIVFNLVSDYSSVAGEYDQCINCLYKPGECDLSGQKSSCAGE